MIGQINPLLTIAGTVLVPISLRLPLVSIIGAGFIGLGFAQVLVRLEQLAGCSETRPSLMAGSNH